MTYKFADFTLDTVERALHHSGSAVPLTPKAYEILLALVENAGHVTDKDTLLKRVWPDSFVEEANLSQHVFTLRRALGDTPTGAAFIETVPKRGYRFIATVQAPSNDGLPAVPPPAAQEPSRVRAFWLPSAVLLFLAVVFVSIFTFGRTRGPSSEGAPPRAILAVLPFDNYAGDPNQDFIADGLTEEMITQLGRLAPERLGVIARTSSMSFKGTKKSVREIAGALHADYVLEGSVRRDGDRVRISAQLIEAKGQTHVWAQSYERESRDFLRVQDEIAQAIAREIRIELTPLPAARAAGIRTVDLAAHDDYLHGRASLRLTTEPAVREAVRYFERSIGRDPGYAPSYTGLADAGIALTDFYVQPDEWIAKARAAAHKAIELDETLAEAHISAGAIHLLFDWDWEGAEREFRRALAINPSSGEGHAWYAYHLAVLGRPDESIVEARTAVAIDPFSVSAQLNAGWVYYLARRPEDAVKMVRRALELDPHLGITHSSVWMAYAPDPSLIGQVAIDPDSSGTLGLAALAGAFGMSGNRIKAMEILSRLKRAESDQWVCPYEMAAAYATLRDSEEVFRYLDKSYRERSGCLPDLLTDPRFDAVRSDPRFAGLLKKLNLSPRIVP